MKTDRQQRALKIIYDYWKKNRTYPTNAKIVELLGDIKDANSWGNTRRAMIKNGKLKESKSGSWDFKLPDEILADFIENDKRVSEMSSSSLTSQKSDEKSSVATHIRPSTKITLQPNLVNSSMKPGDIQIYGQVRAGSGGSNDLVVDLSPSGDTLNLLDVDDSRPVYALEVYGSSMVSDSILPNDFVIVEKVSFLEIKDGDLIVAKYLKTEFNEINDPDELDTVFENPNNYDGPTLKYFRQIPLKIILVDGNEFRETKYQLAPKNKDPRYTIVTRHIASDDLGRVISVHRMIRKL